MNRLTALVVDDDEMARTSIIRLCEKSGEFDDIVSFDNAEDASQYLFKSKPDVVFLDVEMPGINGIELLKSFNDIANVIIISGKTDYAFDAYQLNVLDYLPKPVTLPRLLKALEKVQLPEEESASDIYVRVDGKLTRVPFKTIDYVESLTDYVRIHTETDKLVVYSSLKHIESKLPAKDFMKVHRSYIVNMNKIKDIDENLIVIKEALIPISRANQPELIKRLNLLK